MEFFFDIPLAWRAAVLGFGGVLALILIGLPIAFAMLAVGMAGIVAVVNERSLMGMAGQLPYTTVVCFKNIDVHWADILYKILT
ncbi:MAG: hypothetical protein AAGF49_14720 [Pseudomonadota bacterium]